MAGTAAPLNPGYKEEEFRFYLEDTNAKVLLLPPDGVDEARARGRRHGADPRRSTWTPPAPSRLSASTARHAVAVAVASTTSR